LHSISQNLSKIRGAQVPGRQAGRALSQADLTFPAHQLPRGFHPFGLSDQTTHFAPRQTANLFGR